MTPIPTCVQIFWAFFIIRSCLPLANIGHLFHGIIPSLFESSENRVVYKEKK